MADGLPLHVLLDVAPLKQTYSKKYLSLIFYSPCPSGRGPIEAHHVEDVHISIQVPLHVLLDVAPLKPAYERPGVLLGLALHVLLDVAPLKQ